MELITGLVAPYPETSSAFGALWPLLSRCGDVRYSGQISEKNSYQITSDFDDRLRDVLWRNGATETELSLPQGALKEYDFAFEFAGHRVAVEVEKTQKWKIFYDILKCHMYLRGDAAFVLLVLPKNYAHGTGKWDLYSDGVKWYRQCLEFGFGTHETFDRILIVGYEQRTLDGERLTPQIRERFIANRPGALPKPEAP
jgi:hypothetical protein